MHIILTIVIAYTFLNIFETLYFINTSVYDLHRIEALVMPKNIPSIRVLDKLGFEDEGLSKKMLKVNGVWEDHIRRSLLNPRHH